MGPKVHLLLMAGLAACVLPSAVGTASPARGAANPMLFAVVGTMAAPEAFSNTFKDSNGDVTNLAPGTYDVQVDDWATFHSFHMTGPNGDVVSTGIPETSHTTVTITFTDGLYRFKCDAHPLSMKGSFTVGTPPPPPPQCVVPNVRGLALAAATARIDSANCTTGKVTRAYSRTKKGRVIAQSPGPRTRLDAGASVRLTISRGPKAKPHRP